MAYIAVALVAGVLLLTASAQAERTLAWWHLDDGQGTVAACVGDAPADATVSGEWIEGVQGEALRFGSGDRLRAGPVTEWAADDSKSFAVDLHIRTTQQGFACVLVAKDGVGGVTEYSLILGRTPGTISFEVWSWQQVKLISRTQVNDGNWHHVLGAYSAETNLAWLVVDGKLEAVARAGRGGAATALLSIGNNVDADQPFIGDIDEVRLLAGVPADAHAMVEGVERMTVFDPADLTQGYARYVDRIAEPRPWRPTSLNEWTARREEIRRRVLDDLGLWPLPDRPPLSVRHGGKLERDGYTLERIYWETWPGFWAAGYLYMPTGATFPAPAVLNPHGHWENGNRNDIVQTRCIALAQKGYICLAPDSAHILIPNDADLYDWSTGVVPQTVMTWDNIRALDLLESMPEVDKGNIASTGCSGGAQQTFYLTAVEDRLKVAIPVCMISKFRTIIASNVAHCACNHVPYIAADTDTPEMAARQAPNASFIITVTGDWTKDFPTDDYPDLLATYELYGAEEKLGASHHDCGHDYNKDMRQEAYWFLSKWLKGIDDPAQAAEPDVVTESLETLAALDASPVEHQTVAPIVAEFRVRRGFRFDPGATAESARQAQEHVREGILALMREGPDSATQPGALTEGTDEIEGLTVERLKIASEPDVRVPAVLINMPGAAPGDAVIIVSPGGAQAAWAEHGDEIRRLAADSARVLLMDPRFMGEWAGAVNTPTADLNGIFLGRPVGALGAHDVLQAAAYLRTRPDVTRVCAIGYGDAAVLALVAGALDEGIAEVEAREVGDTFLAGRELPRFPQILDVADLPQLAACIAPRPLAISGASDPSAFGATRRTYELLGQVAALRL